MGAIHFSIDPLLAGLLASRLDLSVFIETGTFHGDSVAVVRQFFKEIHTCELSPELYAAAAQRFANDPAVGCHLASSSDWLPTIVPRYSGRPVMFWLDAHWCVAGHTKGEESQCPLLDELKALGPLHADSVIWIDDARYFTAPPPQPLQAKGWPTFQQVLERLQSLSKVHHMVLADDTILFYPPKVSSEVAEYLHIHGADWLAIAHNSRLIPELNQGLQAKEKALLEVHGARELAQKQTQELSRELTAKEKALLEAHGARELAQKQTQELSRELTAKDEKLRTAEKKSREIAQQTEIHLLSWKKQFSEKSKMVQVAMFITNPFVFLASRPLLRTIFDLRRQVELPQFLPGQEAINLRTESKAESPASSGSSNSIHQQLVAKEEVIQKLLLEKRAWMATGFLLWPLQRLMLHAIKRKKEITKIRLGELRQYAPKMYTFHVRTIPKLKPSIPTISVVTPSYNQGRFLPETIGSVLGQGYPLLQYVVQDGGSKDGSAELIQNYASSLHAWESAPDRGQAHAINLGFQKTSGEIMAWLNGDDLYTPNTLWKVAQFFQDNPQVDVVYGHRLIINEHGHQIGSWIMPEHNDEILSWADYVPQETLFWRRCAWEKAGGGLDESFYFAMDWDLLLRFRREGAKMVCLPAMLGCFRVHESQKTSQELGHRGKEEMEFLRQRVHGRIPSDAEVWRNIKTYLRKSIVSYWGWRVLHSLKRIVLGKEKQTIIT